jgi:hypothetical protein
MASSYHVRYLALGMLKKYAHLLTRMLTLGFQVALEDMELLSSRSAATPFSAGKSLRTARPSAFPLPRLLPLPCWPNPLRPPSTRILFLRMMMIAAMMSPPLRPPLPARPPALRSSTPPRIPPSLLLPLRMLPNLPRPLRTLLSPPRSPNLSLRRARSPSLPKSPSLHLLLPRQPSLNLPKALVEAI